MKRSFFTISIAAFSLILFILPHTTIITRPLIGLHDMDNGHLLTTTFIWRTEGIIKHHFAPIYTFSPGDINLRPWGMVGNNNRMYHASYPPLSFWMVYLMSYVPGVGISEATARLTSLFAFVFALVFLFTYLYTSYNLSTAVFGSGIFSLLPASAYFYGGVIVADIAMVASWIPSFVLLTWYIRSKSKIILILFILVFALATLTEWLGILTAGVLFIYFCIKLCISKKSIPKPARILPFAIAGVTFLSLLITVSVYVSVSTPQNFIHFLENKYLNRGNIVSIKSALAQKENIIQISSETARRWYKRVVIGYLWVEYTPLFWILVFLSIILLLFLPIIAKKTKHKSRWLKPVLSKANMDNSLIFAYFFLPPFAHTLLLSEFHFIHDYSYLSFIPFFTLISAKGFFMVTSIIEKRLNMKLHWWQSSWFHHKRHYGKNILNQRTNSPLPDGRQGTGRTRGTLGAGISFTGIVFATILLFALYLLAQPSYHFLFVDQTGGWTSTIDLFIAARKKTNPQDLILTSHSYNPDLWFYLRRNVIQWVKYKSDLPLTYGYFNTFPRVFYVADYRPFFDSVCAGKKEIPAAHGWMCRLK